MVDDHLGSTRALVKDDGTIERQFDYKPFGEDIASDVNGRGAPYLASFNSQGNEQKRFTGKERDAETGLDYFGAMKCWVSLNLHLFDSPIRRQSRVAQFSCLYGDAKRTVLQLFRRVWALISRILLTSRSQIPTCLASCSLGARSQSDVELSHNLFKLITFCD